MLLFRDLDEIRIVIWMNIAKPFSASPYVGAKLPDIIVVVGDSTDGVSSSCLDVCFLNMDLTDTNACITEYRATRKWNFGT